MQARCQQCRKKTLFTNECKCLKKFCLNCSPFYAHNCSYDYKKDRKDFISEANPEIIPIKVSSI